MTIYCKTENNIIVDVAPVAKIFMKQNIKNLASWMKKQGLFIWSELKPLDENSLDLIQKLNKPIE